MAEFRDKPLYGDRYHEALTLAARLHNHQVRKQSGIPYISHLLSVSALVWEMGGNEDQAIAALLHDSLEDVNCSINNIYARFGRRVASLVWYCTDEHKRRDDCFLPLEMEDQEWILVKLADSLHNARSLVYGSGLMSDEFIERQIPKHESIVNQVLDNKLDTPRVSELLGLIRSLKEWIAND